MNTFYLDKDAEISANQAERRRCFNNLLLMGVSGGGGGVETFRLLAENNDNIITEDSNYLQTE